MIDARAENRIDLGNIVMEEIAAPIIDTKTVNTSMKSLLETLRLFEEARRGVHY